jgi:uncharacterized protein YndB with AHSA1/START domain/DNA-binding transcriptional ArsR family regulator
VFSTCYPQATWGNVSPISRRQGGSRQCQLTLGWDVLTCVAAAPRGRTGDAQHGDPGTEPFIPFAPAFSRHDLRDLICDQIVTYSGRVDEVFRALADPTRRSLLDELYREDGQTLGALEARFEITRFGVMKHLRQLEDAGLVVTRRQGRQKLHYLNPVPIRLVHDRWVSKYAEPWAAGLSDLKTRLESPMEKVFEIYIRTTPERLWEAITDGDTRSNYWFGNQFTSEWTQGSRIEMSNPRAEMLLGEGENIEVDPPRRLVQKMVALWSDDVKSEGASRVTWEIEPVGDSCRLTVIHDQLRDGANPEIYGGWPMILSGLKTWLETGERLTTPGSLMYG